MALTPRQTDYNIPGISQQPITSDGRGPSQTFVRFWEQVRTSIAVALSGIQGQVTDLAAIQRTQAAQQAQILAQNAQILAQQTAINQALGLSQIAQSTANDAQTAADAAGGGTARSASATNPSVNLFGTGWIGGPIVNLTGVSAGNLTITGTGPQQDDDVFMSSGTSISGKYRVVEVIGGIDGTSWEFNFSASAPNYPDTLATVVNTDASAVASFSQALATTGAVSYRIDAQRVIGGTLDALTLYIFVRRS